MSGNGNGNDKWKRLGAYGVSVAGGVFLLKGVLFPKLENKEVGRKSRGDEGDAGSFVCERVCTSDRLIARLGGLSKEPTRGTCVTVCGTSGSDSCTEACQRAVCMNMHQVPAWNDQCLKRCTQECMRGRSGP